MKNIAVIGAGTMGAGIAQLAASHGCSVRLIDVADDAVTRGYHTIAGHLQRSVDKERITSSERDEILARINTAAEMNDLDETELAIEAVIEKLDVKRKVFMTLEQEAAGAILATNTSSLPVSEIATAVSDPSRVIGMHFFNPAPIMPLVEIIATAQSSPAHIDSAFAAAQSWGKVPVRAKDTPGFIVNRVARGYYLEALRMLGEGVAGVDEIDGVMRAHGGFRMGPFELMDLVGLDVNYAVSCSVFEQMNGNPRFAPHEIQSQLVERGKLGRKTGVGFYDYGHDSPLPAYSVDRRSFTYPAELADACQLFAVAAGAAEAGRTEQYIFGRILGAIINEGGYAFSEGVASSDDIDIAMRYGTNYPHGPLEWADDIGHPHVYSLLVHFNEVVEDGRYEPAPLFGAS